MKLYQTTAGIVLHADSGYYLLDNQNWDALVNHDDVIGILQGLIPTLQSVNEDWLSQQTLLAPIGSQEVWAAGVTYIRSKVARMEESKDAGGGSFYDRVYDAPRPEIFFKSTPGRVVGTNAPVRIRKDSTWDVPEPELTLFFNSKGVLKGYSIGNDMSSRSIEGENPLYLPQAKMYDGCCALGPCLYLTDEVLSPNTTITLSIHRNHEKAFGGSVAISQIKRSFAELGEYLFSEMSFPDGCYLMTGTGIVPPNEFTLQSGDVITIEIEGIGQIKNWVA
ncbi:MAG: fumarylacetoacetate hydrolase family protein [Spirosomataceae bacterium]